MNKTKISLEEYTKEFCCEISRNGGWEPRNVELSAQLRIAKAAEGIKEQLRTLEEMLWDSQWCSFRCAVEKMANKGITIRHEHLLTLKLHWSIRWPWQQETKRRQRTWRLFRGKKH